MIWTYLLLFIATMLTQLLTALHLPRVSNLPEILGIDVDTTMTQGVSIAHSFFVLFWPLTDMLIGALFIVGYLALKNIVLRTFLGHRAPGNK